MNKLWRSSRSRHSVVCKNAWKRSNAVAVGEVEEDAMMLDARVGMQRKLGV